MASSMAWTDRMLGRWPENVNMRALIRYAEAAGMSLDVRLVAKKA